MNTSSAKSVNVPEWFSRLEVDPGKPTWFDRLSWTQIDSMLRSGKDMLILPVGATEQHGPHLPINTDSVIVTAICQYVSARTGVPILPTLDYTVSIGHTEKWPGTFSVFHETFINTVREITQWAVATGWRRVLIVNSHEGNDASLRVAVERMRFDHVNSLQVALLNTYAITPSVAGYFKVDSDCMHANQAETDLMLFLKPDTVRMEAVQDEPDRATGKVFSYTSAHTSLNGVSGAPSKGNPEKGKSLFLEIGAALIDTIEKAAEEVAPMDWNRSTHVFGFPPEPHLSSHKQI